MFKLDDRYMDIFCFLNYFLRLKINVNLSVVYKKSKESENQIVESPFFV